MNSRIRVRSSLAMLYPRERQIELAGKSMSAIELRIIDIAGIEDDAALLAGSPLARHADLFDLIEQRRDEFNRLPREERLRLGREYYRRQESWPPRMGSVDFGEIMATDEGMIAFLWRTLSRTNAGFTIPDAVDLAAEMAPRCWVAVEKVAWGYQPWEDFAPAGGKNGPGRGLDWGAAVDELSRERGWTYAQIGELYIGQFVNARSNGNKRDVTLAPWGD